MTPEVVLGTSQVLFLPEDHPLLNTVNRVFGSFGVQGRITASSDGPTLYHLELMVLVDTVEGDALVSSLMSDRARSLILEEVDGDASAEERGLRCGQHDPQHLTRGDPGTCMLSIFTPLHAYTVSSVQTAAARSRGDQFSGRSTLIVRIRFNRLRGWDGSE